jgi:hypothetical protein
MMEEGGWWEIAIEFAGFIDLSSKNKRRKSS